MHYIKGVSSIACAWRLGEVEKQRKQALGGQLALRGMGVGSTSSHPLSALFPDARSGKSIKQKKNFSPVDIFPRRNPMLGECDADAAAGGPSAFSHTQKLSTRQEENAENSFFCSRRGLLSPFCFSSILFLSGKEGKVHLFPLSVVASRTHNQSEAGGESRRGKVDN